MASSIALMDSCGNYPRSSFAKEDILRILLCAKRTLIHIGADITNVSIRPAPDTLGTSSLKGVNDACLVGYLDILVTLLVWLWFRILFPCKGLHGTRCC
mmetsp:Transcript_13802/g.33714  ORF Transcript_13802/g.33714 Transcript_13802/m.33714 type:complete len:99 (+) Transcript_13802:183-479(+)